MQGGGWLCLWHPPTMPRLLILALSLCAQPHLGRAEEAKPTPSAPGVVVTLWPKGAMPGQPVTGPERTLPARGDHVVRLTDISEPSFTVYAAPNAAKPTPAVIICPGGGYGILAYDKEGTEVAAWLNSLGITGVVLKYRVPNSQEGAFLDIQRTIRLVRQRAAEWNIDRDRVGAMGFSAGGHLAARLSTLGGPATYPRLDDADDQPLRPNFAILVYPAYLDKGVAKFIDAQTSPTFLAHAEDDKGFIKGSKVYHESLLAAKVSTQFFKVATGGHGHGLRSEKEIKAWPDQCRDWLKQIGMLPAAR
jgi:acetyl esterase/lipase